MIGLCQVLLNHIIKRIYYIKVLKRLNYERILHTLYKNTLTKIIKTRKKLCYEILSMFIKINHAQYGNIKIKN